MYSSVYRTLRLFLRGGMETRRHFNQLRRMQRLSKDELERYQLAKIQRVVRHAYDHIPYYRNLYKRLDIHPEDVKSLSDFQSLPVITKPEIIDNLEEFVQPELRDRAQEVMTGGSTGEPMKVYVEDSFWWWNAAYEFRGREWYRVKEGDKIAWFWGAQTDMHDENFSAKLKAKILRHRYLNAFGMTETRMQEFANMLLEWRPEMFRAYASTLYLFAQFIKENNLATVRPKLIETTAEKLLPHQRKLIEEVFQAPIAECYVAREFGTIGYMCPSGKIHLCETRYVEALDEKNQPVPPGEYGFPVTTSLHQFLMPLIRYRMDDEITYELDPCPCGRTLPTLKEIRGRSNDYIYTPEGKVVHYGFFTVCFWEKPEIARFQIYQSDVQRVEIRFILNKEVNRSWMDEVNAMLRAELGDSIQIDLQFVDDIPLTRAGKERYVISDVKPEYTQHLVIE